jgi:predicted TPR repeat methyltransferase
VLKEGDRMDHGEPGGRLDRLAEYETTGESTAPFYDDWSATYEHDLLTVYGYNAHLIAAAAFGEACPDRSTRVVDFGCGTGLVGVELSRLGFSTIDGVDVSEPMRELARSKAVYQQLHHGDLTARTSIADDHYGAAICVGSFAPGHLGPPSLAEIARCVAPGGVIVVFMNADYFIADGYQAHLDALAERGVWQIREVSTHNYMSALDRPGRLIIAQR